MFRKASAGAPGRTRTSNPPDSQYENRACRGQTYSTRQTPIRALKKTFMVQADLRTKTERRSIRIKIGISAEMTTRKARTAARDVLSKIARGEDPGNRSEKVPQKPEEPTLREAWQRLGAIATWAIPDKQARSWGLPRRLAPRNDNETTRLCRGAGFRSAGNQVPIPPIARYLISR
jgi:hypothetical protein